MKAFISNKLSRVCLMALFGLMVLATGCKKDDASTTLNGTSWAGTTTYSGYQVTVTISFKQSSFTYTENILAENVSVSVPGTYTYDYPNVECQGTLSGNTYNLTGTISGNQMTINDSGQIYVLTKQ